MSKTGPFNRGQTTGRVCAGCGTTITGRRYKTGGRNACSLTCVANLGGGCPTIYIPGAEAGE